MYFQRNTEMRDAVHGKFYDYLIEKNLIPNEDYKGNIRCLSPDHADNNPSMGIDRHGRFPRLRCFSCKKTMDIFDLIQLLERDAEGKPVATNFSQALNWAMDHWNLRPGKGEQIEQKSSRTSANSTTALNNQYSDFTPAFLIANKNLQNSPNGQKYLKETRGLSDRQIEQYMGIVPEGHGVNELLKDQPSHKINEKEGSRAKILLFYPDEKGEMIYFQARRVNDKNADQSKEPKYINPSKAARPFFQEHLIKNPPEVIMVTEGVYDALALQRLNERLSLPEGFMDVVALGGSESYVDRFLKLVKHHNPNKETCFVLATDSDRAGRGAAESLIEGLEQAGYPAVRFEPQGVKDFDEAWRKDTEKFIDSAKHFLETVPARSNPDAVLKYKESLDERRAENKQKKKDAYYRSHSASHLIDELFDRIENGAKYEPIPTELGPLDELFGGGIQPETYVIAAQPSAGKSAFLLQLIDNLAKSGVDCLFFSLEMDADQQMLRSLSRHTFEISKGRVGSPELAKDTRGISISSNYVFYTDQEMEVISEAIDEYNIYNDHIFFFSGEEYKTTDAIQKRIEEYLEFSDNKFVVFVDYLQILKPDPKHHTPITKQNIDFVTGFLKELSVRYKIPVLTISSMNRVSYDGLAMNRALKESGDTEYTFDNIIFLEYAAEHAARNSKDEEKYLAYERDRDAKSAAGEAVEIRLRMTKQRNDGKGECSFKYYRKYHYFEALEKKETPTGYTSPIGEKLSQYAGSKRKGDGRL